MSKNNLNGKANNANNVNAEEVNSPKESVLKFKSDLSSSENTKEVSTLPPQFVVVNKIRALFGCDGELSISIEQGADNNYMIHIESQNYYKIKALSQILKKEIDNVKIDFIYADEDNAYSRTLKDAFANNKHLHRIRIATEAETGAKHIITIFKDETLQYQADSRFVPNGYETVLAQDLVGELFEDEYLRSVYITEEKSPDKIITPYWDDFVQHTPTLIAPIYRR